MVQQTRAVDPKLTDADVRDALSSMESSSGVLADYRVDVPRFAASIVSQLPIYRDATDASAAPTTFRSPDATSLKAMPQADASATLAQALAVYRGIEKSHGTLAADIAMTTGADAAKVSVSAPDAGLLGLLQEGATRLTFMFGQPNETQWSWKVTNVSVVGTDTADVTYSLAAPSDKPFRFTASTQTKRLHFEKRPDGVWVIDGWLDYPAFESAVKGSIKPSDEIPNLVPNWWDTLGAE